MAAGVPVVVSDWDGYRYTVSDGVEGFLIPTLAPSYSDQGAELAFQHDHGLLTYQDYVGSMAQHVAVDIDAAVAALVSLANDPSYDRMGYAGRQTVRNRFDWSVVAQLYLNLYSELLKYVPLAISLLVLRRNTHYEDPFHDFSSFATSSMSSHTKIVLAISSSDAHHFLANLTSLDLTYHTSRISARTQTSVISSATSRSMLPEVFLSHGLLTSTCHYAFVDLVGKIWL